VGLVVKKMTSPSSTPLLLIRILLQFLVMVWKPVFQLFLEKHETAFNSDAYETKQVFFTSKDGTRVPMFVNWEEGF